MNIRVVVAAMALAVASIAVTAIVSASAVSNDIVQAVADPSRPKDDRDADALRAPAETLAFSGVKPGMTVFELYPCGGYFSRLLIDVVGPRGKIYGTDNIGWNGCSEATQKAIAGHANYALESEPFGAFRLPQKVDLFWITQNYHDLHIRKYGFVDLARFNQAVFDSLKKGGVYFILDHAANPGTTEADIANLHRIEKAQVIKEVEAAGFKLAGEGDFLHRTSDDHTKSIFDASIRGHTDQYALKFIKP
jgi:predicted methyltransferase